MSLLFRRRLPLRWFLVLPYFIQLLVVVSLTGWLSYQNGQATVKGLASKLLVQAKLRVHERTDRLLMQAQQVAVENAFLYQENYLSLQKEKKLEQHFEQQRLNVQPKTHSIYIGDEEGRFLSYKKGNLISIANPKTQTRSVYQIDPQTKEREFFTSQPYDPRQRPWYQQAKNSNGPIWTEPYEFATLGTLGITTAQSIRDEQGALRGVAGVDLSLEELNLFLQSIQISSSTKLFIVDDQGQLIATSIPEKQNQNTSEANQSTLQLATESSHPFIRKSTQYLQQRAGGLEQLEETQLIELVLDNQQHYLSTLSYRFGNTLQWHVVVLVSEQDFNQQIANNKRITILLCAISVFGALAVGSIISRMLAYSLKKLETNVDQVAQGSWQAPNFTDSTVARTSEMGKLMDAFDAMVKRLQQVFSELENYAYKDPLTGLPNRAALLSKLDYAISIATPKSVPNFALLWLDIDSFVRIETGLGERTAEQLLREVTHRIQESIRQCNAMNTATIARIERDDFIILLGNLKDASAAQVTAQRILTDFQTPFRLGQQDVVITANIGIFIDQGAKDSPSSILNNANIARFSAKQQGKAQFVVFDSLMRAQNAERLQLEADLRYAIERDELEIWYQPLVTVEPEGIAGFEALVRWRHPTAGLINPDKFITIAEETGAIAAMGLWILRTASAQMQQWRSQVPHLASTYISINVSAQQLLIPDFVDNVQQILQDTGLPGEFLQLEITESAAVSQPRAISRKLKFLQSLGIRICMDDFGTGYCQLSYLLQLPVDAIKIDRTFVNGIGDDETSQTDPSKGAIAKTLLALSKTLDLDVTAEGIESPQQFWALRRQGCNKFQGYLFSAPVPKEQVPKFSFVLPSKDNA